MSKSTINKQQLILEFLSVVFAVLLALFLNGWRESVATDRALEKVKQTIRTEIMSNDSLLAASMTYRRSLVQELYDGTHLIMQLPAAALPINVSNDLQLENYLKQTLPFSQSRPVTYVKVQSLQDERIVSINDLTMKLRLINDTLKVFGPSNIRLRSADISNRSWDIAQATGVIVEMDLGLVDALNKVYTLNNQYLKTSDKAIDMVYKGDPGIRSVLEDMYYFESQIIKSDSVVLALLD